MEIEGRPTLLYWHHPFAFVCKLDCVLLYSFHILESPYHNAISYVCNGNKPDLPEVSEIQGGALIMYYR